MRHEEADQFLFPHGWSRSFDEHLLNGCGVGACATHLRPKFASLIAMHAQTIHGNLKVLALLNSIANRADKGKRFTDSRGFIGGYVQIAIPYSLIDHKLYM